MNCDSLQLYRYFDVGTAKLGAAERREIAHHLIDILEPAGLFTAGEYARAGRQVLEEIRGRKRLPVLVGGTGFYLRALLEGLSPAPVRDPDLRAGLLEHERRRPGFLHRVLGRFDPAAAARIHANDLPKLTRAVEICLLAGKQASSVQAIPRQALKGFRALKLGLNPLRETLSRVLDERARRMFREGLTEEVRSILDRGVPPTAKPFESLGYKQALQCLRGEITPEQAVADTQTATRRYAKRQLTWFRREKDVIWLEGFGNDPHIVERALGEVSTFLKSAGEP